MMILEDAVRFVTLRLRNWFGGVVGEADPKTTRNLFYLFMIALTVIAVGLVVVVAVVLMRCTFPPGSDALCSYGEVGDLFGGLLNPILTFLAFMGLLITIAVQKDELSQTRSHLKAAAEAQSDIASLQKQEFSAAYIFRLLESLRDTAKNTILHKKETKIDDSDKDKGAQFKTRHYTVSGSQATMLIMAACTKTADKSKTLKSPADIAQQTGNEEYGYISSHMSSYFEQLSYILNWIETYSENKSEHYALLVSNMFYQEVYVAYIFAQHEYQTKLRDLLTNANLIELIPNHQTVFDDAFRVESS